MRFPQKSKFSGRDARFVELPFASLQSRDLHETEFQRPAVSRRNVSDCGNLGIEILPETQRQTCFGWN